MTVPHRVIYQSPPANGLVTRRRDEKATSPGGVRAAQLVGRVDDGPPRQRVQSTGRALQRVSPSPAAASNGLGTAAVRRQTATATTGFKQGPKGRQSPSQHSDVFTFASDTEAASPAPQR